MNEALAKEFNGERMDGEMAVYLFAFASTGLLPELKETGLDGRHPLVLLDWQGITAVTCPAPLGDFTGSEGEARLQDIVWLEPRVCRHQEIVSRIMRHSPVLPARFGTLFSHLETLQELMKRHHAMIAEFLDRVADKEEWAVKGLLNTGASRDRLLAETLADHAGKLASLPPGRRYFYEQRLRAAIGRELQIQVQKVSRQIAARLMPAAAEFRERRRLPRSPGSESGDMVLNWAFLVPREDVADFQSRLHQAEQEEAAPELILEHSGPWPPYSFSPPLN